VQFTDASTGTPTSWSWSFGDGSTSTSRNPTHTYTTAGSKTVSLTATNSSSTNTNSQVVTVASVETLEASFSFSPSSPAPGQAVAFRDTSTESPTSWQWNFGDGGTSTAQNPSHSYTTEGSYVVTLIAGNGTGSSTVSRTVAVAASSEILPADRLYDWGAYCGVPGGIPSRTTIFRTMTATNTAAEINAAITACPAGQVIYLSAGTYSIGQINFGNKSGVTLRGAGAGQTIIHSTVNYGISNSQPEFLESAGIVVTAGYTAGSTVITLASTPTSHFIVGNLIVISENPSPDKWATGIGTYYRTGFTSGSNVYNLTATRIFHYTSRIVSVSGNNVTIATPIPVSFTPSLNIKAYAPTSDNKTSLCGVENMTLDAADVRDYPVSWMGADRCWLKNIEIKRVNGADVGFVRMNWCFQCEIRGCFIHDATGYPNQQDGQGSSFNFGTCNSLLVDCVVDNVACMMQNNGASANAFLYNYAHDITRAGSLMHGFNINHAPHGHMNLLEGNIIPSFFNDGYHGGGSHTVLFRNNINGLNFDATVQRKIINMCRGSYYQSVVGNVLGDSSWNASYYDTPASTNSIYVLGYPTSDNTSCSTYTEVPWANWSKPTNQPDADVVGTLTRHGNYDYYHKNVIWDSAISSHVISDSLYYSSKPAFFGSLHWPPIGPEVSGLVTPIPAKARWDAYYASGNLSDLF
jgi:PKD repeat protein